MDRYQEPQTQLVPVDIGQLFPDAVLADDSPIWIAWEMAKAKYLTAKYSKSRSQATRSAYAQDLKLFEDWLGELGVQYWEVTPSLAQEWANWMGTEGKILEKDDQGNVTQRGPLAKSTVNRRLAAVSGFFDYVIYKEIAQVPDGRYISLWDACHPQQHGLGNPFKVVDRHPIKPFGRSVYPTTEEVNDMFDGINTDCLEGLRDYALLYVIITTCLRAAPVLEMKWGDIQPLSDGHFSLTYIYKGGDTRKCKLSHTAYMHICAYLRADGRPPEDMQAGDYIFIPLYPMRAARLPDHDPQDLDPGRPISHTTASEILKKHGRRAGVDADKCHLHGLRHAGARQRYDMMKAAGEVDLLELSRVLGHSSVALTQIYIDRCLAEPEDRMIDDVDRAFGKRPRRRRKKTQPPPQQDTFLEASE